MSRTLINISNQKYGNLTVISLDRMNEKHQSYWKCLCDCGKETIVRKDFLTCNHTQSCGCLAKLNHYKLPNGNAALNKLLYSYKYGAKIRNLEWKLSEEEFLRLVSDICYYCERKPETIKHGNNGSGDFIYNGIDRINSNREYIIDNCISCCYICNRAKSDMTYDDFTKWLMKVGKRWGA